MKLTDAEIALIEAGRNFKNPKHHYSPEPEWFVRQLSETLLYDDED